MNNSDNSREKSIVNISVGGMIVNIVLAAVKFILGQLSGSVAISSDAVNSITDSSSSLITIIGTKLAQKKPDKKHPFGYGRIEYLASLIIGVMVVVTGAEATISAVKSIISPEDVDYAPITLIVLGISIAVKIFLGLFTKKAGKRLRSGALEASGKDAVIDAIMSAVTIVSAIIFIITKFSIDAYAGAFISLLIEEVAEKVDSVSEVTKEVAELSVKISEDSHNAAESIAQITTGVDQISNVIQTTSATAQQSAAASQELSGQANMLQQEISQFKLNDKT